MDLSTLNMIFVPLPKNGISVLIMVILSSFALREDVKKRIFYGQAERKGGLGGGFQSFGQCPKIRSFLRLPLGKTLGFI